MKTLQDWMNEYYPVDAQTFVDNLPEGMTKTEKDIALVKHALKKWKGAEDRILTEYNLDFVNAAIVPTGFNEEEFDFNTKSCALCAAYFDEKAGLTCPKCPLYIARGTRCDCCLNDSQTLEATAPYNFALWEDDPLPMIQFLKKVLADLEHQHEEMTRK